MLGWLRDAAAPLPSSAGCRHGLDLTRHVLAAGRPLRRDLVFGILTVLDLPFMLLSYFSVDPLLRAARHPLPPTWPRTCPPRPPRAQLRMCGLCLLAALGRAFNDTFSVTTLAQSFGP